MTIKAVVRIILDAVGEQHRPNNKAMHFYKLFQSSSSEHASKPCAIKNAQICSIISLDAPAPVQNNPSSRLSRRRLILKLGICTAQYRETISNCTRSLLVCKHKGNNGSMWTGRWYRPRCSSTLLTTHGLVGKVLLWAPGEIFSFLLCADYHVACVVIQYFDDFKLGKEQHACNKRVDGYRAFPLRKQGTNCGRREWL